MYSDFLHIMTSALPHFRTGSQISQCAFDADVDDESATSITFHPEETTKDVTPLNMYQKMNNLTNNDNEFTKNIRNQKQSATGTPAQRAISALSHVQGQSFSSSLGTCTRSLLCIALTLMLLGTPLGAVAGTPFGGGAAPIFPKAVINASDFDVNGSADKYNTAAPTYRNDTKLSIPSYLGRQFIVLQPDSWATYTFDIAAAGTYTLTLRLCARYNVYYYGIDLIASGFTFLDPTATNSGSTVRKGSLYGNSLCGTYGPEYSGDTVKFNVKATTAVTAATLNISYFTTSYQYQTYVVGVSQLLMLPANTSILTGATAPTIGASTNTTIGLANYLLSTESGAFFSTASIASLSYKVGNVPMPNVTLSALMGPPLLPIDNSSAANGPATLLYNGDKVAYRVNAAKSGLYKFHVRLSRYSSALYLVLRRVRTASETSFSPVETAYRAAKSPTGFSIETISFDTLVYFGKGESEFQFYTYSHAYPLQLYDVILEKMSDPASTVPGIILGKNFLYPSDTETDPFVSSRGQSSTLSSPSASTTARTDTFMRVTDRAEIPNGGTLTYGITFVDTETYTVAFSICSIYSASTTTSITVTAVFMNKTIAFSADYYGSCSSYPYSLSADAAKGLTVTPPAAGTYQMALSLSTTYTYQTVWVDYIFVDRKQSSTSSVSSRVSVPGTFSAADFDYGVSFSLGSTTKKPFEAGNSTRRPLSVPVHVDYSTSKDVVQLDGVQYVSYTLYNVSTSGTYNISAKVYSQNIGIISLYINGGNTVIASTTVAKQFNNNYITVVLGSFVPIRRSTAGTAPVQLRLEATSGNPHYIESITFTLVQALPDDSTPTSIPIPGFVPAVNLSIADSSDVSLLNTGNATTFRPLISADIFITPTAPQQPKFSIGNLENGDILVYNLTANASGWYSPKIFLVSLLDVSNAYLSSRFEISNGRGRTLTYNVYPAGYHRTYQGINTQTNWAQDMPAMYFPAGPSTVTIKVTYSSTTYSPYVFLHGFSFTYLRGTPLLNSSGTFALATPAKIGEFGGVIEAENYEISAAQASGPALMPWAGNETTYRADRYVSLFKSDVVDPVTQFPSSRFVNNPTNTTDFLAYTVEMVAGVSYQMKIRARCNANVNFYYYVYLERDEVSSYPFTSSAQSVTNRNLYMYCSGVNLKWTNLATTFSLPSTFEAGFYTLYLFGNANNLMVDYLSFEPSSGPFEGKVVSLPNRIELWRFDCNSHYEPNALPNTGNVQTLRYGTDADIFRDGNGNYTLGDMVNGEYMSYTVRVTDPAVYDVIFIGETTDTNVRFELLFNSTYLSGPLLISAAGVYADTNTPDGDRILASFSLPFGDTTVQVKSLSTEFRFMTAIRFIRPAQQTTSRSFFADNGLLQSTYIAAYQFDHGGAGIAFSSAISSYSTSTPSRSGSIFAEIASDGLTALRFSSSKCTYIYYTFRVRKSSSASLALNWRSYYTYSSYTATARMTLEEINPTTGAATALFFNGTQSILSASLTVSVFGEAYLSSSKTYRVTLSDFSYYEAVIASIVVDTTTATVLGASCYEFNSLSNAGCASVVNKGTTCSLHSTTAAFPGLSSSEYPTCAAGTTAGVMQRFTVPTTPTKQPYAGAHLLLSAEGEVGPTEALSVAKTFKIGDIMFQSAVAKVVVDAQGFSVYQTNRKNADGSDVLVGQPSWTYSTSTCRTPLSSIRWNPTSISSTTPRLAGFSDEGNCNKFYFHSTGSYGYNYMWLDGCTLRISSLSPAAYATATSTAKYYTINIGGTCAHTVDSIYNKVEAEYSSGRIEKIGSFVVGTDMPAGANVAFRYVGSSLPGKPTSNCANRNFTNGLPIVSVPFSQRSGETVAAIRVVNYDNYRRVLVAGLGWVGNAEECTLPSFPNVTAAHHRAHAMTFGSTASESTVSSVLECAANCESNSGCAFYQYTEKSSTSKRCIFLSSLQQPAPLIDTATTMTFIGAAPGALAPLVRLSPTTQPSTLHRVADFPQTDSWTAIVYFVTRGATFSVTVSGANGLAAAAPRYLFTKETDWITLSHPRGLKQYGNAFNAFDNDGTVDGTITPSCTALGRMVTTGMHDMSAYPISGAVYLTFGHLLGSPAQCSTTKLGLAALYVRGTIANPKAPVLSAVTTYLLSHQNFEAPLRLGTGSPARYSSEIKSTATAYDKSVYLGTVACSFFGAAGFVRQVGVKSTSSTCLSQYTQISLEDLARKCEADASCEGFSTTGATGATETGACLATSATTTAVSDSVFYQRRRPSSAPCTHTTVASSSALKIEVSLSDFALPNQFITVSIAGEIFARCGGRYGFVDQAPSGGKCKSFAVCYDGPLMVPVNTAIQVTMSEAVKSAACASTEVVLAFRTESSFLTGFPALNFGAQTNGLWMQPFTFGSLLSRTHSIRVVNMTTFSAFIQNERQASFASVSRFSFAVKGAADATVSGLSFVCTQSYVGARSDCAHQFFHCKSRFGNATTAGPYDYVDRFTAIPFATITSTFTPFTTQDCPMTTGVILHDGTPLSTPINNDYVRTRYVVFMPDDLAPAGSASSLLGTGTGSWANMTHTNAAATALARPSATLDVLPKLWHFARYFRNTPVGRSYSAALVDIPGIATTDLKWNVTGVNGTACIIDAFNGQKRRVCTFDIEGANFLSLYVAQTQYTDATMTVQIELGETTYTCGETKSFTGANGEAANCGKFFACLHTVVDTTTIKSMKVSFSGPADESLCEIPVAAILLPRVLPALTANCGDSDLVCRIDNKCVPQSKVCDGVADCSDASDEAYCSSWRLVSKTRKPTCTNIASITGRDLLSFDECKAFAIAKSLNQSSTDISVVFRTNTLCEVYTCVSGANVLSTTNEANRTGYFYSHIEDTSGFGMCTAELSCLGRGRVSASSPPCVCVCESGYTGTDCASPLDMTAVSFIAVETTSDLSAGQRQSLKTYIEGSLRQHGLSSGNVRVSKIDKLGTTTDTRAFGTQAATNSYYYSAEITDSSLGSSAESVAIAGALSASAISSLNSSLLASSINVVDISSMTLLQKSGKVLCNITIGTDQKQFCDVIRFNASDYATAVLLDYTVIFYGSLSGWTVSVDGLGGTACTSSDVTVSNLGCNTIRKCAASLSTPMKGLTMRPTIDYGSAPVGSAELCSSVSPTSLMVEVQFNYINRLPDTTAKVGSAAGVVSIETEDSKTALKILYGLAAATIVLLIISSVMRKKGRVYLAALFMTMLSVCVMAAIIMVMQYLDGRYEESRFDIFVFEYRTPKCSNSSFNPIPHRISRVQANDRCARAEAFGTSEGVVFMRGSCGASTYSGAVTFNAAYSMGGCNSGARNSLKAGQCYAESDVMNKSAALSQYIEMRCYNRTESADLINTVTSQYRPNTPPVENVEPTSLSDLEKYIGASGKEQFFRGTRRHEQSAVTVPTGNNKVFGAINRVNSTLVGTIPFEFRKPEGGIELPADLGTGSTLGNMSVNFNTAAGATEDKFGADALRYLGMQGSSIDVDPGKPFTVTFWAKMSDTSTGFIFALTDNWEVTQTNENPILRKVTEVLQNGLNKNNYFSKVWNLYLGLYANARAKTLTLVYASPTSDGNGVVELNWDMAGRKVQGERIFDGNWHFLAIVFDKENGGEYARLFIDGQTSFVDEGWKVCLDKSLRGVKALPAEVPVYSAADEQARHGAVLYVGHINAPIYDLQVRKERLLQEKIIGLGTPYMKRYAAIDVTNSLRLGYILGFLALGSLILAIILFMVAKCRARRQEEALSKLTQDKNKNNAGSQAAGGVGSTGGKLVGRLKSGKSGGSATNSSALNGVSRMGSGVMRQATHLRMVVLPFVTVAQTMAIYFQGWQWPEMFRINASFAVFWLSFDINLSFPEIPAMVTPAIQVFLAFGVFFFILAVLSQDNEQFVEKVKNKGGLPNPTTHPDLPVEFTITGRKKLIIRDPIHAAAFGKSIRKAIRGGPTKPALCNVSFHGFPEVPAACVLSSVGTAERSAVRMTINNPHVLHALSLDPSQPFSGIVQCEVPDAPKCPEHKEVLIKSITHVHNLVMDSEGMSPYFCAYQCGEGAVYKKLRGDKVYVCPGRAEEFLVCSIDSCSYCICSACFEGGPVAKAKSAMGSKIYNFRRFGVFPILGFVILLVAQTLHMPIMKNAFMIVYCHVNYQCLFPTCYDNPTSTYLTFVAFAVIIIAVMGVGLVVYLFRTALQRKRLINDFMKVDGSSCLASMEPADWDELLMADNSLLKNLYEPYTYRWMWVHPTTLVFKLGAVLPIVFAAPNSLTQLSLAAFAEVVQLIFWIITNPFLDYWVGFLTHAGSIHQVAQLALMCFQRVALSEDPDDNRFAFYMVYVSIAYTVILVCVIVFAMIIPTIQSFRSSSEAAKLAAEEAEAEQRKLKEEEEQQEQQHAHANEVQNSPINPYPTDYSVAVPPPQDPQPDMTQDPNYVSGVDDNDATYNHMTVRSNNNESVNEPASDHDSKRLEAGSRGQLL